MASKVLAWRLFMLALLPQNANEFDECAEINDFITWGRIQFSIL